MKHGVYSFPYTMHAPLLQVLGSSGFFSEEDAVSMAQTCKLFNEEFMPNYRLSKTSLKITWKQAQLLESLPNITHLKMTGEYLPGVAFPRALQWLDISSSRNVRDISFVSGLVAHEHFVGTVG